MPKVSVILATYNREKYLKECIESVLKQTYSDFEFIIVDDASTDGSRDIINSFSDYRIKVKYEDKNRNVAYASNVALMMASGKYIAKIDSDDIWEENKLEIQMDYMESHPECGACFSRVNIINENSIIDNVKYVDYFNLFNECENQSSKDWMRFFFYVGNCLCNPTVLMRKSVLEDVGMYYHLAYVTAEDYELWTRLVVKSSIHILDEKLVRYRACEEDIKISGSKDGRKYAFPNVQMLTRKRVFDNLSDEKFIEFFGEDFINKDSVSHEELECEKAQILLKCSGDDVNFLGLEKYEELLGKTNNLKILEERMNFSLSQYYSDYRKMNFGISQELNQANLEIQNLKNENQILKENNENLQQELFRVNNLLDEVLHSTSWKVTEPLRNIMLKVRKDK